VFTEGYCYVATGPPWRFGDEEMTQSDKDLFVFITTQKSIGHAT
jgi:hypothetical protein